MLLVGIPLYNGRATLRDALNSLCAQTKKNFIVCIYDDCSTSKCDDIISEYKKRLKIRYIKGKENLGPGGAREAILRDNLENTPSCDYIMFLDADDMLYPRATELLYTEAKKQNADIVIGKIAIEGDSHDICELPIEKSTTWFHAKCYSTNYLKNINLHFLPDLRYNEDSYYNLVAYLSTENKFSIEEPLYLWRNNKSSITRSEDNFSLKYNYLYFYSQVRAAQFLLMTPNAYKLAATFNNIYKSYQKILLLDQDRIGWADIILRGLFGDKSIYNAFNDARFVAILPQVLTQAEVLNETSVLFYPDSFDRWCKNFGIDLDKIEPTYTYVDGEKDE